MTIIQGGEFKVLQAIMSESMGRIKNMFRQKFCECEEDVINHTIDLTLTLLKSGQSYF